MGPRGLGFVESVSCFKPGSKLAGISGAREYIAGRPHVTETHDHDKMAWGRLNQQKKAEPPARYICSTSERDRQLASLFVRSGLSPPPIGRFHSLNNHTTDCIRWQSSINLHLQIERQHDMNYTHRTGRMVHCCSTICSMPHIALWGPLTALLWCSPPPPRVYNTKRMTRLKRCVGKQNRLGSDGRLAPDSDSVL